MDSSLARAHLKYDSSDFISRLTRSAATSAFDCGTPYTLSSAFLAHCGQLESAWLFLYMDMDGRGSPILGY